MNLKRWAEREGVSYATARRWFETGELPVPARRAGRLILVGEALPGDPAGITVVCARVSAADRKPDLGRQVAAVTAWAVGEGLTSLCARLYGRRSAANRAARAVSALTEDPP